MKLIAEITEDGNWKEIEGKGMFANKEDMINYFEKRYDYTKLKFDLEKGKMWLLDGVSHEKNKGDL